MQLQQEQRKGSSLQEELKAAKEQNVIVVCFFLQLIVLSARSLESRCSHFVGLQQKQAEQEEEFIVNKLMKRLDQLKREKQVLANEVCTEDTVGSE